MSIKPYTKKCSYDKCIKLNVKGEYCVRHWILNKDSKQFTKFQKWPWQKLYYTNTWKKLRIKHLSDNPLCKECGTPAKEVDHIIDHKGDRELFYDLNNLQTLCKSCHSTKTMQTIRIRNFKKTNEVIKIIISPVKSDFSKIEKMMSYGNISKSYLSKMIVKSNFDKKKFYVKNNLEMNEIKNSYILFSKSNPIFKIIQEV